MLETYLSQLDLGYWEATFVFEGLSDTHVWTRPAPGLLSVGEVAAHIAYWEAVRLAGERGSDEHEADLTKCPIKSLLLDERFSYYPTTLETPPSGEQRAMTAAQVGSELQRIHKESVAIFKAQNVDLDSLPPGSSPGSTYGEQLKYLVFHIAYHTGQMYSVRHLLGEATPDN